MSSSLPKPGAGESQSSFQGPVSLANGKSSPHNHGHELQSLDPKVRTPLPIEEDLMQLARLGEVGAIQKLFDSGKFSATYKDEEGITALHWAAINNHYALCKYLIQSGAEINAKGGESVATPAMWAAQRCHYYIVNLLLQNGADPLLTDAQGYNILHLATIDGNAFLIVLLLHQEIPVDVVDPQGHTSLMWAAYKGYPALVDLLLRWGASVNARDEGGLTPLHWALVRGSQACIQKMIEYGADRYAETNDGKTPTMVAGEMKSTGHWRRALADCGYDAFGRPKKYPIFRNKNVMSNVFFFWPFVYMFIAMSILSHTVMYIGIPVAMLFLIGMQLAIKRFALLGPGEFRNLHRTPHMAGIFAGSLFWVGLRWVSTVLPSTYSTHPFLNLLFLAAGGLTTYFYFLAMFEDPGFVPKLGSRNQQRKVIEELFGLWKFDEENFCIQCLIRRPLRSKHCRKCRRCVAKHDHHCPWIHNCVGSNNLRHFVLYIFSLEIGILFFIRLVIYYLQALPVPTTEDATTQCTLLPPALCTYYIRDPFTIILSIWTTAQLVWVTMLSIVQLVQISRNQTTYENMRGNHGVGTHNSAIATALATGTTDPEAAALTAAGAGPNPAAGAASAQPTRKKEAGYCTNLTNLIGLDAFVRTAKSSRDRRAARRNPWNMGIVRNCRDFWCDGVGFFGDRSHKSKTGGGVGIGLLGGQRVDWTRLWDVPRAGSMGVGINGGMEYRRLVRDGDDEDEEEELEREGVLGRETV